MKREDVHLSGVGALEVVHKFRYENSGGGIHELRSFISAHSQEKGVQEKVVHIEKKNDDIPKNVCFIMNHYIRAK